MSMIHFTYLFGILFSYNILFGTLGAAFKAAPIVTINQGKLQGLKELTLKGKEFYSYKGIPFAEPPLGSLRFKAPVPGAPWIGILNATKDADFCLQKMYISNITDQDPPRMLYAREDCLYLNVFTPKIAAETTQYPVMIYIHGGSFIMGGAQKQPPYVLMEEDIVLVVIQYRLGIFGFLSTEDSVIPGNMGFKDQQMAIRWVQENIASFRGDPNTVTLFGESAGSASVHLQILSPDSKGLFQRAIMQSATALAPFMVFNHHRKYAIEAGNYFGCSLNSGSESFLECMQKLDENALQDYAHSRLRWEFLNLASLPRVDGDFLPDFPENLMRDGRFSKVDIMAGFTRDESVFSIQLFYDIPTTLNDLNSNFDVYGPISLVMENEPNPADLARQGFQHYLNRENVTVTLDDDEESLLKMYSDYAFKSNFDLFVQYMVEYPDVPLYTYEFEYVGEFTSYGYTAGIKNKNWAAHTDDLLYLFSGGPIMTFVMTREDDLKLREIMVSTWTNFAKTGNPTPPGSEVIWEKNSKNNFQQFRLTEDPEMEPYDLSNISEYWLGVDTWQNRRLGTVRLN